MEHPISSSNERLIRDQIIIDSVILVLWIYGLVVAITNGNTADTILVVIGVVCSAISLVMSVRALRRHMSLPQGDAML